MKTTLIILALVSLAAAAGYWLANNVTPPAKQVVVSAPVPVPDLRIAEIEARVKTLEAWAQRQGMRY